MAYPYIYRTSIHLINCPIVFVASAFGATEAVPSRSITKDQYKKNNYIPDWCDKKWAEGSEKSLV